MEGEQGRERSDTATRFRRRLSELKRNGCNVLLVGTDALDVACERLLGESSAGPRYRLFVTADARPATARAKVASVESGRDSDSTAVVNWQIDVRDPDSGDSTRRETVTPDSADAGGQSSVVQGGGATGESVAGDTDSTVSTVSVESHDFEELQRAVEDVIASFETDSDGLSPAELRLCFDSMTPLVADETNVERFVTTLTETVEQARGMGHYHLPVEYGSEMVASVEPLFDAVVEVRHGEEAVEQRWHLTDADLVTEWLPL